MTVKHIRLAALSALLLPTLVGARFAASEPMPPNNRVSADVANPSTDLGPQIFTAETRAVAFGRDGDKDRLYVVRTGAMDGGATPGCLLEIDPNPGAILHQVNLPGSEGSWGVTVATDGLVYACVYRSGHVFQYRPGSDTVADLGPVTGNSHLYYLTPGPDGSIFGGGYPLGQLFQYIPGQGYRFHPAEGPILPGLNYVRGTAYDPVNHVVYAGGATPVQLLRCDLRTGERRNILPRELAGEKFILGLRVVGSKVLARLNDGAKMVVLDVSADGAEVRTDAVFDCGSIYASPESDGIVYYTAGGALRAYDLAKKTWRDLGGAWPSNAVQFAVLTLTDQENYPGRTLVGVGSAQGQIWLGKYNLATGRTTHAPLPIPEVNQTIESIIAGPDGRIYSSGYLSGGTGVHTPFKSASGPTLRGVAQCEGSAVLDGRIYYGGYPGAIIYEHDPSAAWDFPRNPKVLFKLAPEGQDRPFGMSSGGGRVIIGTAPNYGQLGGTLCLYDPVTRTRVLKQHHEIGITDLSLISTCYQDGMIYGGTSVSGGIGIAPTQTRAKLLIYDLAHGTGRGVALPEDIPNQQAITSVCVGPDGKIWLMCGGWLVVYNPATGKFEHRANLFPQVVYHPTAAQVVLRDATLMLTRRGQMYGTISNHVLFRLDPVTKVMTEILTDPAGCTDLAEDEQGNLYYIAETKLCRWTPKD